MHESNVVHDEEAGVFRFYTTRLGEKNKIMSRLGEGLEGVEILKSPTGWFITVPEKYCRTTASVVKMVNPDKKVKMTDEMKAAMRGANSKNEED